MIKPVLLLVLPPIYSGICLKMAMRELSNNLLTLWFPDSSFYPGQIELRKVYKNLLEKGLPVDPVEEYVKSEYQRKIEWKRG